MNPEKEIVNLWLNKKGFFTINDINAGKNKVIDLIAIKLTNGKLERVEHIEVNCSISSTLVDKDINEYIKKFEDKTVIKKVKQVIKDFVGTDFNYEKTLILTSHKNINLKGINVLKFDDILYDVIDNIDKQNYRNTTVRIIQLIKYLLISNPNNLAELLKKETGNKVLNQGTREIFIRELLKQDDVKRILEKESNEKIIVDIVKESSLKRPERLAKALEQDILTNRTRNRFLKSLLVQEKIAKASKTILKPKKQKSLQYFFKKKNPKAKV
ncbi:MAG: hypothetical protein KJ968_03735 [Nanoarchaeota archaeon]|nr:hypothetical protein [Nanoarchaeota archaeon]MBU4284194.1 hypothetical protein [Nanoarchaeota archaeon]